MKRTFRTTLATLAAATLVLAAGQSFAAGTETVAGTDIFNTASVTYTLVGVTVTADSPQVSFKVDRKINMVVTNTGNATIAAGGTDYVLRFTVTNLSNTKVGDTDYFNITANEIGGDDFNMAGYAVYNDDGLVPGTWDATNTVVTNPVTINVDDTATFFIVADAPANGINPGDTALYDLVATAADNTGAVLNQTGSNDPLLEDIAWADGLNAITGDTAGNGVHSDRGTYTVAGAISVLKTASDPGFYIPGSTVVYTIGVNNGDATNDASGVTISDPIPANTTYVLNSLSCTGTGFTEEYDHGLGFVVLETPITDVIAVRCYNGSIAAGGSASMAFSVTID